MNHGELFWVDLPDRGGREQRGRRPAVLWQDTKAFRGLPTVLIIPLTTRVDALRFAGTLSIQPTNCNGLASPSVALVFQLGACDIRRIGPKIGQLDTSDVTQLRDLTIRFQKLV